MPVVASHGGSAAPACRRPSPLRRAAAGFCVFLAGLLPPGLRAGALEDYLANPAAIENPPCSPEDPPARGIVLYQRRLRQAKTDRERGIAVSNLAFIARRMAAVPESHAAVRELMAKWVMPNLKFTHGIELTSSCCWRRTVISCRNTYGQLGQREAERECLAMLYRANSRPGDRDMAVYLLAFQQARHGEYPAAIRTINFLPADSKWAHPRKQLIRQWTQLHVQQQKTAEK